MHTADDARRFVIEAIDAGDAHHSQYDLDAIVAGIYDATGDYDPEALGHDDFWALVEAHDRITDPIELHTYAIPPTETGEVQRVSVESATRAALPLADRVEPSAHDLGCEPGAEYRVLAVTPDGAVLDSVIVTAR
ncbi:hypothetical protein [Nocardia paucivorans]|uniref:hypothetical protein n=1 Tax=Nocardia paucivorans TaxID=114259 RepID=UPI0002DEBFF9|nr:hypothetical protein [Nocardia paucivorans]